MENNYDHFVEDFGDFRATRCWVGRSYVRFDQYDIMHHCKIHPENDPKGIKYFYDMVRGLNHPLINSARYRHVGTIVQVESTDDLVIRDNDRKDMRTIPYGMSYALSVVTESEHHHIFPFSKWFFCFLIPAQVDKMLKSTLGDNHRQVISYLSPCVADTDDLRTNIACLRRDSFNDFHCVPGRWTTNRYFAPCMDLETVTKKVFDFFKMKYDPIAANLISTTSTISRNSFNELTKGTYRRSQIKRATYIIQSLFKKDNLPYNLRTDKYPEYDPMIDELFPLYKKQMFEKKEKKAIHKKFKEEDKGDYSKILPSLIPLIPKVEEIREEKLKNADSTNFIIVTQLYNEVLFVDVIKETEKFFNTVKKYEKIFDDMEKDMASPLMTGDFKDNEEVTFYKGKGPLARVVKSDKSPLLGLVKVKTKCIVSTCTYFEIDQVYYKCSKYVRRKNRNKVSPKNNEKYMKAGLRECRKAFADRADIPLRKIRNSQNINRRLMEDIKARVDYVISGKGRLKREENERLKEIERQKLEIERQLQEDRNAHLQQSFIQFGCDDDGDGDY